MTRLSERSGGTSIGSIAAVLAARALAMRASYVTRPIVRPASPVTLRDRPAVGRWKFGPTCRGGPGVLYVSPRALVAQVDRATAS
jgi:hypothetical protein